MSYWDSLYLPLGAFFFLFFENYFSFQSLITGIVFYITIVGFSLRLLKLLCSCLFIGVFQFVITEYLWLLLGVLLFSDPFLYHLFFTFLPFTIIFIAYWACLFYLCALWPLQNWRLISLIVVGVLIGEEEKCKSFLFKIELYLPFAILKSTLNHGKGKFLKKKHGLAHRKMFLLW